MAVGVVDVLAFWERTGDDRAATSWDTQAQAARALVMKAQAGNSEAAAELATIQADMDATPR